MFKKLNSGLDSFFSNSDINKLLGIIFVAVVFLWFFIDEIAPLFGGVLIAYLLEDITQWMERHKIKRAIAASLIVLLIVVGAAIALALLPLFIIQLQGVLNDLPNIKSEIIALIQALDEYLPGGAGISEDDINEGLKNSVGAAGKFLLDNSLGIVADVFSLFLYIVLLPLLVFFLLKDKIIIINALKRYAPSTTIFAELWKSVDVQFGSYVRGKFIEAAIIGVASWIGFVIFDMNYAFSLATIIGLSVFVPFVGAVAVTIPVVLLAYIQFGGDSAFFWVMGIYAIIQIFDGQVLVPLLFSEVVKLHPIAIFAAIIFFGGLWGVWGVFFAIPLASLIKSLILVIDARRAI